MEEGENDDEGCNVDFNNSNYNIGMNSLNDCLPNACESVTN